MSHFVSVVQQRLMGHNEKKKEVFKKLTKSLCHLTVSLMRLWVRHNENEKCV